MRRDDPEFGLRTTPDTWPKGQRLESAARIAGLGHYVWDVVADRCLLCSDEHAAIHGMSVVDYLEQSSTTNGMAHPDDLEVVRAAFERLRGGERFDIEFRIVTPAGDTRFIREIGHPIFDDDGRVIQEIGTSQEVTTRKMLEIALLETEEALFAGIEALPVGFAAYSAEGRLRFFNEKYKRLLPLSGPMLKPGLHIEDLIRNSAERASRSMGYDDLETYVRDRLVATRAGEKRWTHQQVTGRWIAVAHHPTANGGFISIMEDISEQKAQEEQLRQAQKMEAVGQLTGGVAHDFNNLLAIVQGNAELVLPELQGENATFIRDILRAVEKGSELTQRLLAFSRRQVLAPQPLDLVQLVSSFIGMLDRTLGEEIAIRFSSGANVANAFADRSQVESALLNLAINARDAMPGGGILSIECYNQSEEGEDFVVLAVKDNGTGMTEEQKARAFDPFYTTKEIGEGSGLGLSMVYGFAKQSGGHARILGEEGVGTTVEILLPKATGAPIGHQDAPMRPVFSGKGENILVIEDNPDLRELFSKLLLDLNFSPVCVRDARTARGMIEKGTSFALVLSDVVLPGGISGPQFAGQLAAQGRRLKFLFTSGFARSVGPEADGAATPKLLKKPFSKVELASAIKELLEGV